MAELTKVYMTYNTNYKLNRLKEKYNNVNLNTVSMNDIVHELSDKVNYVYVEELTELINAYNNRDINNMIEEIGDIYITSEMVEIKYALTVPIIKMLDVISINPLADLLKELQKSIKYFRGVLDDDEMVDSIIKVKGICRILINNYKLNAKLIESWINIKKKRIVSNYLNNTMK